MAAQATSRTKSVDVSYNGSTRKFDYEPQELVQTLLQQAVQAFGISMNAHMMSLYDEKGRELPDAATLKKAGVGRGDDLVLRQSVVKGG